MAKMNPLTIKEFLKTRELKMVSYDRGCRCPACQAVKKGKNYEEIWVLEDVKFGTLSIELKPADRYFHISVESNPVDEEGLNSFKNIVDILKDLEKIASTQRVISKNAGPDYIIIDMYASWDNYNTPVNKHKDVDRQSKKVASFAKEEDALKWLKNNPIDIDIWS